MIKIEHTDDPGLPKGVGGAMARAVVVHARDTEAGLEGG